MKIKIFTIIAIFTVVGFCQDYIKENYNVNDGLISSSVSTIYQDRNGFIWIGSNEGISRFDGQEFVNYKRPEFFNSGIKKFLQINKDELIILNNDGSIFRFDGMSFVKDSSFNSIIDIDYYNNKLFTIDNNGLTIEGEEKKYYSLKLKKFQQNKDQLYLIGYNSIFVWNEGKPKPLFKNEPYQFSSIIKHSTGNFWVGTKNNGVLKYENEKWIKLSYYPGVEIFDIKEEKSTAVWVSKNIGLERIIQNSLGDIYNFSEILTINSSSVYIDKKNNIWCGSSGNGLYKYHKNLFNNFTANSGFSAIFGTVLLMDSKNRLWTQAYGNGLIMFDNKINYFNESTGFPGKIALSCVEDREGNVLIAADGQIYKYMNDQFILQDRKNLPEERIRILLNDGQNIWASLSIQGVWKHEDNEWLKFPLPTDYKEYSIISMFQDSKNGLWFGGWRSGLFYYNGDSVVSFLGDSLFMETKIYSIIEDNSNNIWVGTENGAFVIDGLNVIDTINSEKGLRSNKVYALGKYEDKILLGTAEGFSIYDDGLISTFTTENGLSSNDISSDKILIDEVGKVWMGNTAGVSMFNIQNYLEQERTYKILLTSVETSTDTLNYSVFADDMIILPEFSTNLDFR